MQKNELYYNLNKRIEPYYNTILSYHKYGRIASSSGKIEQIVDADNQISFTKSLGRTPNCFWKHFVK